MYMRKCSLLLGDPNLRPLDIGDGKVARVGKPTTNYILLFDRGRTCNIHASHAAFPWYVDCAIQL